MEKETKPSLAADLWTMFKPNPLVSLVGGSVISIVVAIIVFGEKSPYKNPLFSDFFRTIGIGVLAAAVSAIIDHNLLFKNFEGRIRDSLLEAKDMTLALRKLGVQNAYKPFAFSQIFAEAKGGETVAWLDTYCPLQNDFLDALQEALQRKVELRMLIIDPICDNARNRNVELTGQPDSGAAFEASLGAFVAKMEAIAEKSSGKLKIRYYQDLPCAPMYLIVKKDRARKAFFSLFLSEATAHCTHLELSDGEWLRNMWTYFDMKWKRAESSDSQSPSDSQSWKDAEGL